MVEIVSWLHTFLQALNVTFADRVWFVGLQGSYGRGEATKTSDIDVVVILDELLASDIQIYQSMLDNLPNRELICGFLSGKQEVLNWEPSDLFQFYYDTQPIVGSMDELLPLLDEDCVRRAIKIGACNINHGCVHNMLHDQSVLILRDLYKAASFVVQAICYYQTGSYIRLKTDLLSYVSMDEKMIINTFLDMKNGEKVDFYKSSVALFDWSKKWISKEL